MPSDPKGEKPRKMLEETIGLDVTNLSSDQINDLKTKIRNLVGGHTKKLRPGEGVVVMSHSSHGDNDGTI